MSVSTIRPPPPRPPRPAGPARPHLHLGVGVHVLQLEPRVPVVVLLQVFLPDGHLPWKINAEETSHEGTNPPTQQGWEQSPLPLPVTPDGKSRTDHRERDDAVRAADANLHLGGATSTLSRARLEVTATVSTAWVWTGAPPRHPGCGRWGHPAQTLQIRERLYQVHCSGPGGWRVGWGEAAGTPGSHVPAIPAPMPKLQSEAGQRLPGGLCCRVPGSARVPV